MQSIIMAIVFLLSGGGSLLYFSRDNAKKDRLRVVDAATIASQLRAAALSLVTEAEKLFGAKTDVVKSHG